MKPLNLYDAKNVYLASVLVEENADTSATVRWDNRLFRFETQDRARETPVIDVDPAPLHRVERAAVNPARE